MDHTTLLKGVTIATTASILAYFAYFKSSKRHENVSICKDRTIDHEEEFYRRIFNFPEYQLTKEEEKEVHVDFSKLIDIYESEDNIIHSDCDEAKKKEFIIQFFNTIRTHEFVILHMPPKEQKIIKQMFEALGEFMDLPFDEKRYASTSEYKGYSIHETKGFETFQYRLNSDEEFKWPTNPPYFKERAEKYFMLLVRIAKILLFALAEYLNHSDINYIADLMYKYPPEEGKYSSDVVRMFKYINKLDKDQNDLIHIDIALLALIPKSLVSGLQVFRRNREVWINAEDYAEYGDLVFIPGSIIEILSSSLIKGTIHRVKRRANTERLSLPIAIVPANSSNIQPLSTTLAFPKDFWFNYEFPIKSEEYVSSEYRKRVFRRIRSFLEGSEREHEH